MYDIVNLSCHIRQSAHKVFILFWSRICKLICFDNILCGLAFPSWSKAPRQKQNKRFNNSIYDSISNENPLITNMYSLVFVTPSKLISKSP